MTSSLLPLVGLVFLLALLPWLIQRLRQRSVAGQLANASAMKIVSAMAVGPHQKLLTVEVGPPEARAWLVLGVSAQSVTCLHHMAVALSADAVVGAAPATALAQPL
jgi:flagellar protein FliO/FliZ